MALQSNKILNEKTSAKEFAELLEEAKKLPANGIVYECGDIKMKHTPSTRVRCEAVYVLRYGTVRRSLLINGKWSRPDQPNAFAEFV